MLDDSVLWLGRAQLRGGASHMELDQEGCAVRFQIERGGKISSRDSTASAPWRKPSKPLGCRSRQCRGENVENCRRAFEAWNRRDIDGWLAQAAPDFEWIPANPAAVERNVYRGDEEIRQAFAEIWEIWEVFRLEESEIRDLGGSVVWLGRIHARGRTSHVELDHDFAVHILLREDEGIRAEAFLTWPEALEAAGLPAET